jgi:hypothetical protein
MIRPVRRIVPFAAVALGFLFALAVYVQSALASPAPTTVVVAIYHVAPGKHAEFLKWMAARDAIAKQAGIADTQWYAHLDGDSWDYLSIGPKTTDAQDDKTDEIAKSKGMTSGFAAGVEFRTMISSHTDTYARGPTTSAALAEAATK